MLGKILEAMKEEGVRGSITINKFLDLLDASNPELAESIEEEIDGLSLMGTQRLDTLLLSLVDQEVDQDKGEDDDPEEINE